MRLPHPALALIASLFVQDSPKTPIAWTLKKDQKVRYEFNHRLVSGPKDRTNVMDLTLVVGVEGGDYGADGTNAAKLTFERIVLSKTGHGDKEDYDSARDKEPPAGSYPRVLSKCVGKTLPIRISASGSLTALDEIRKMVLGAVDAFPDLKGRSKWDAEGVDLVARRFEWLLKAGFETPKGGRAAPGDSWETSYDNKEITQGVGRALVTATLKSVKAGEALVDQAVKFEFAAPVAAAIKEATGKGTFAWDTERGMLKSLGITSKIVSLRGDVTHTVTVALKPDAPAK